MTLTLHNAATFDPDAPIAPARVDSKLPAEAEFIMSALEAARGGGRPERRVVGRCLHRAVARLRLFSDARDAEPWEIYTRDGAPRAMGFITRHRLPLGYGGLVTLIGPDGEELAIDCTVHRCRETVEGWFEGSLSFNREQPAFKGRARAAKDEAQQPVLCGVPDASN